MSREVEMTLGDSIKVLRCFLVGVAMLLGSETVAQKYYLANEGDMSIHFGYNHGIFTGNSDEVDVIFNRDKIVLWVTIKGSDFKTGNRKIDRRLFRKNEDEFMVKVEILQKDVIYGQEELLQFSLIGRVFNDVDGGPVSIMGALGDSLDGHQGNLTLYLYFGVEGKWFGKRFIKYSDYPVVNIRLEAELQPYEDTELSVSKNN